MSTEQAAQTIAKDAGLRAKISVEGCGHIRCEHCTSPVAPREAEQWLFNVQTLFGERQVWCIRCVQWASGQLVSVASYKLRIGPGSPDLSQRRKGG